MSKSHPQQWAVNTATPRPDQELVAAFADFPTTQIADSGGPVGVVGPGITHVAGGEELCGAALTLWTKPGDILFVLKSPDLVQTGDVLVIDGGGRLDAAVIGDILGGAIQRNGGVGLVVDGVVRDTDGLDRLGLPTFARGTYPTTGSNEGPGALNVGVQCGGVRVEPGDIVRGDASGLVVIPREHARTVLELTKAVDTRERDWAAGIANGTPLSATLGLDAIIAARHDNEEPAP
jgi:4-hydroxy-4-methyl-2-oxoglutarate aldolase